MEGGRAKWVRREEHPGNIVAILGLEVLNLAGQRGFGPFEGADVGRVDAEDRADVSRGCIDGFLICIRESGQGRESGAGSGGEGRTDLCVDVF